MYKRQTLPPGVPADSLVLLLPNLITPGPLGDTLTAILAAGAFAAFLSTASGLAMAVAGVLDQDVVRPALGLTQGAKGIRSFRLATVAATTIPCLLLLGVSGAGLATTVGLAFALTASTFCPLLMLGVWWRRLTAAGALAGMSVGAVAALVATIATVAVSYTHLDVYKRQVQAVLRHGGPPLEVSRRCLTQLRETLRHL